MPELQQTGTHWRANSRLTALALIAAAICLIGLPLFATSLDEIHILRFPLGFYLIAQGAVFAIIALIYWFGGRQDRLDQKYNLSGDY